jgi:hypothetical protein
VTDVERAEDLRLKCLEVRLVHADRKAAGTCINGNAHAAPIVNPRTGKRYTRCEACRAVHSRSA